MNTIPFNTIICMCLCITSIRGSSHYSCLKFKWFIIIWIMFVIMQQTSGCFEKIKSSRSSALSTYYLFIIYFADVVAFLNFTCLFLTPCLAAAPTYSFSSDLYCPVQKYGRETWLQHCSLNLYSTIIFYIWLYCSTDINIYIELIFLFKTYVLNKTNTFITFSYSIIILY